MKLWKWAIVGVIVISSVSVYGGQGLERLKTMVTTPKVTAGDVAIVLLPEEETVIETIKGSLNKAELMNRIAQEGLICERSEHRWDLTSFNNDGSAVRVCNVCGKRQTRAPSPEWVDVQ